MTMVYYGRHRKRYVLGSQLTDGKGGEGTAYNVKGHPDLVAKIYHNTKLAPTTYDKDPGKTLEDKINYMIDHPLDSAFFAWPQDSLQDAGRQFVGYIMPRISGTKLFDAEQPSTRSQVFRTYNYIYNIHIAYNLAATVEQAHRVGVVIGDLNPTNVLVDDKGIVRFIDTDSFSIHDSARNKTYKCMVNYPGHTPPELMGLNMEDPNNKHTIGSDDFVLALHIFELLFDGQHPFTCIIPASPTGSVSCSSTDGKVANGYCPFVTNSQPAIQIPKHAIDVSKCMPLYMRQLIDRAFTYTSGTACKAETIARRPSAQEWREALQHLLQDMEHPGTRGSKAVICPANHEHIYLKSAGYCPFCEARNRKHPLPATVSSGHSSRSNSSSWKTTASPKSSTGTSNSNAAPRSQGNYHKAQPAAAAATYQMSGGKWIPVPVAAASGSIGGGMNVGSGAINQITAGTSSSAAGTIHAPVSVWPLYLLYIVIGLTSGYLLGPVYMNLFNSWMDLGITQTMGQITVTVIGIILAIILSMLCEEDYIAEMQDKEHLLSTMIVLLVYAVLIPIASILIAIVATLALLLILGLFIAAGWIVALFIFLILYLVFR